MNSLIFFERFAIAESTKERVFEVVVRDGRVQMWPFEMEKYNSSDLQVKDYPYRLQQAGEAEKSVCSSNSWIQELRNDGMDSIMTYLVEQPSELPIKVKVAFGQMCFHPISTRFPRSTISWTELEQFATRWSNVCGRTSPSVVALLGELEKEMEKGVVSQTTMLVHLTDKQKKAYDLKYQVVDGQWKLHNSHVRRVVRGTYDVILDNATSCRLRASTREPIPDDAADFRRHGIISVPDNGDFFCTEVALSRTAPAGLFIRSAVPKSKVHVEMKGLRFSVSYLDEGRKEFRLECRLLEQENLTVDAKDKESQLLLKKVLDALSE